MFKYKITLFRIFGFKVEVDASWLLLAALISWTLSVHYFPSAQKGLPTVTYWQMGLSGMIGLFVSLILHELSHSLVARQFGLPIKGITLFIFGGVAQLEDEPDNPRAEFWIAIAGPIASLILAILFWMLGALSHGLGGPAPLGMVFEYLALVNFVLLIFNLVPGFPLDGGRVFRAFLWWWKNDLRWATKIACNIGDIFGIALIVLGVFSLITGQVISGLWQCLIGMFLRNAASSSYSQLVTQGILVDQSVAQLMTREPVVVSPETSLTQLVDDYILQYNHSWFPVCDEAGVYGFVNMARVRSVAPEQWSQKTVRDICIRADEGNVVAMETSALEAFKQMSRSGARKLLVISDDRLVGILALSDLMKFIAIRMEFKAQN